MKYNMWQQFPGCDSRGMLTEKFLWDGLALIHRGENSYLNEPYVTGGNPLISGEKVLFNDMLGNTLGVKDSSGFNPVKMTAFGETKDKEAFFTGKPAVGDLGYAFLFRNYRPEQGKWQTSDPLGYPDGWNNFAYVNNGVTDRIDWLGGGFVDIILEGDTDSFDIKTPEQIISAEYIIDPESGETRTHIMLSMIFFGAYKINNPEDFSCSSPHCSGHHTHSPHLVNLAPCPYGKEAWYNGELSEWSIAEIITQWQTELIEQWIDYRKTFDNNTESIIVKVQLCE